MSLPLAPFSSTKRCASAAHKVIIPHASRLRPTWRSEGETTVLKDFAAFINRGNVIDLAVAVIIGGAFGAITASLVDQVIMPVIGLLIGGVDFSQIGIIMGPDRDQYATVQQAVAAGAPVMQIGSFLNTVINFLIIAFVVFMIVRAYANMQERFTKKEEAAPAAPPMPTPDQALLTEIRDLLKEQKAQ